jgi:methyl-accepting chemotaxis protein
VAEIAASSREQAAGIEQVNKAVTSMDAVTQQNAALVEEASAAAQALTEQAKNLTQLIENYQIGDAASATAGAPTAAARAAPAVERRGAARPWSGKPAAARRSQTAKQTATASAARAAAPAGGDQEWQDF